jgi:hypothetical protein
VTGHGTDAFTEVGFPFREDSEQLRHHPAGRRRGVDVVVHGYEFDAGSLEPLETARAGAG